MIETILNTIVNPPYELNSTEDYLVPILTSCYMRMVCKSVCRRKELLGCSYVSTILHSKCVRIAQPIVWLMLSPVLQDEISFLWSYAIPISEHPVLWGVYRKPLGEQQPLIRDNAQH